MRLTINHYITVAATVCFVLGVGLSRRVEPGVRVQTVTLAGDIPALKFIPAGSGPHPVALLAQGYTASKEHMFWYAEGLCAAGFICYSPDLPSDAASPRPFSLVEEVRTLGDLARVIGPVDVLVGHSLGGRAGGEAVREGLLRPKLVIAVGSAPRLGEQVPPLLLLVGRFDEFLKSAELKMHNDAQIVISPWSNHGLELFDPLLVRTATAAACRAVGREPPQALTAWRWRIAGLALTMIGALGLALTLPVFPPRWTWARGVVVAALFIAAFVLSAHYCLNLKPHLQNLLLATPAAAVTLALLAGARKFQMRRRVFGALVVAAAICCWLSVGYVIANGSFFLLRVWLFCQVFAPALLLGTIVGAVATVRGSRFSGDVAVVVTVLAGLLSVGTTPRMALAPPQSHVFVALDAKLGDACAGQYEFALDNVFRTGARVAIWRQGDQMFLQATGQGVLHGVHEIFPESETNYLLKINGAELTFIRNGKAK